MTETPVYASIAVYGALTGVSSNCTNREIKLNVPVDDGPTGTKVWMDTTITMD